MTPPDTPEHDSAAPTEALRAWAKGLYSLEAATELLSRALGGRFAQPPWPWIHEESDGGAWIEFETIPDHIGPLSDGERRILTVVASLGAGVPVDLSDVISSLDRGNVALLLAALSHAAGTQEHAEYVPTRTSDAGSVLDPTSPRLDLGPLYPWPEP